MSNRLPPLPAIRAFDLQAHLRYPEDLFRVDHVIAGDKTAPPGNETGCSLQWPA